MRLFRWPTIDVDTEYIKIVGRWGLRMPVMYITINTSVHVDLLNPSNKNNNKCFLLIDYFYIRRNDAYDAWKKPKINLLNKKLKNLLKKQAKITKRKNEEEFIFWHLKKWFLENIENRKNFF